jgi:putative endonuclease
VKTYYVYILSSKRGSLYVGVTNNLERRIFEHKNKLIEGFTKKYNITLLVYYESFDDVKTAIEREKQIKGLLRSKKVELIKTMNPGWEDLSTAWYGNQ